MGHIARQSNDSPLHVKSQVFAIAIVNMVKQNNDWRVNSLFQQILRSGTSIHANVRESEYAQSISDFISKLTISLKEANETKGWLEILFEADCMDDVAFNSLYADCKELIAILVASIKTAKNNKEKIV
ncbi:MAG: four helix bundle protein [Bacteroidaceae bacterium]|nr:four helix bundle protein [Bacteroidaceae bacterium]